MSEKEAPTLHLLSFKVNRVGEVCQRQGQELM